MSAEQPELSASARAAIAEAFLAVMRRRHSELVWTIVPAEREGDVPAAELRAAA